MLEVLDNKLDHFLDSDDESCSISAILQKCNVVSNHNHDKITDIYSDSTLCGDTLESQLTRLSASDVDHHASFPFSSRRPSLAHTYDYDGDSESESFLSDHISDDGKNTVTPERLFRPLKSNCTKSPEPLIIFGNVPMNKIHDQSYDVPYKSAPAASILSTSNVLSPLSQSLSRSSRFQELKVRRRFIEVKYNHYKRVLLTRAMTPPLNFGVPSNSKNSPVKKESPSHQRSHKNESVSLKKSNAGIVIGFLIALPSVCLTWFLCFLMIYSL